MPRAPLLGELSRQSPRLRGYAKAKPLLRPLSPPPSATLISTRKKVPPIKTVIYLDVLLLTNFALTLLFLLAAGLLAGVECRAGRLLLGGAAGAASSLALLAPEAPDAAALLYKVSTAALTVAAAYGWPGSRCFARLVGWFCAGNLLLAGTLLLPGAQTNNGYIYLPLSPGALLAGAGGVVLAVQGVLRFLGRGGGQIFPARLTVADTALDVRAFCDTGFSVQEPLSGRAVVLVRFGAVQGRLPPALGLIWSSTLPGPLPCPSRRWGCALFPAPPWPGTVSCRPSRPACAAPAPPPGRAGPSTSMPPSPTSPRRLMGGKCWWGAKPSAAWRMGRLHFHTTSPCFRRWRRSSLSDRGKAELTAQPPSRLRRQPPLIGGPLAWRKAYTLCQGRPY